MRFPTPNKEIQQLAAILCDEHGFTFDGLDAQEHLKFTTPNGHAYKLSSTPRRTFSVQIELARALKLAGQDPIRGKRNATALRDRADAERERRRQDEAAAQRQWEQAVEAATRQSSIEQRRRQIDRRRNELISIHMLMGAGRVRTF